MTNPFFFYHRDNQNTCVDMYTGVMHGISINLFVMYKKCPVLKLLFDKLMK